MNKKELVEIKKGQTGTGLLIENDGYISLEYEGMEETVEAMEIGAENLKRMLADIEK